MITVSSAILGLMAGAYMLGVLSAHRYVQSVSLLMHAYISSSDVEQYARDKINETHIPRIHSWRKELLTHVVCSLIVSIVNMGIGYAAYLQQDPSTWVIIVGGMANATVIVGYFNTNLQVLADRVQVAMATILRDVDQLIQQNE